MINIDISSQGVSYTGGAFSPTVTYENTTYGGVVPPVCPDWITFEYIGGAQEGDNYVESYRFIVEPNEGVVRNGTITLQCTDTSGNTWNNYITVTQGSGEIVEAPIWKDTFYYAAHTDVFRYSIKNADGVNIYYGKAYCAPGDGGPYVRVNKICQNYLRQNLGDFRALDDDVVENVGAYADFSICDVSSDGSSVELMNYRFLMDYTSQWSGQSPYMMTGLVNGHFDPRMKLLYTEYGDAERENTYIIEENYGGRTGQGASELCGNCGIDGSGYGSSGGIGGSSGGHYNYIEVIVPGGDIPPAGGDNDIVIISNDDWEIIDHPDWVTISGETPGSSGVTGTTGLTDVEIDVDPRFDSGSSRTGVITIRLADGTIVTKTITQRKATERDIPFTIEVFSSGTIRITSYDTNTRTPRSITYSKNNGPWTTVPGDDVYDGSKTGGQSYTEINVGIGDTLTFKNFTPTNRQGTTGPASRGLEGSTATFRVYGNLLSLGYDRYWELDDFPDTDWGFTGAMFWNCTGLLDCTDLLFPGGTKQGCYYDMFNGCTSLSGAPELLPATTIAGYAYTRMFAKCTSLEFAPDLPARTIGENAYQGMFSGCTSLSYIRCLLSSNGQYGALTNNWVKGVPSSGRFIKANGSNWSTPTSSNKSSSIPEGWTVFVE